ncbi:ABC transporter ATP-binding protein, partial [Verrucomicrobiota bacterium]
MEPLVKAENIHKTYMIGRTSVPVLKGASIEVQPGEAVAVVGISGAGKSTLLHILGGLDKPDGLNEEEQGTVLVMGENIYNAAPERRTRIRAAQIGFVFQSYHLLPEMDVLENVMLPAMALGKFARSSLSPLGPRKRALELLTAVGLADRADHTPMELSGGEQQRVALARALMNDPQVVLADEPTGNLDDGTGQQVLDCLFSLTKKRKHTLIIVTHNEKIAA